MRNFSLLLKLLTENKTLKLYFFTIATIGLLSSLSEILIFILLQSSGQLWSNLIIDVNLLILILALFFIVTKPFILLVGSKYVGALEYRLYLDSCSYSLTQFNFGDNRDESQVVTDALVNPLRISSTVYTPLIYAIPAVLSGFLLITFFALRFSEYFVFIGLIGFAYFTVISKYVNSRLRKLSHATHNATHKAKSLLTFFNTDKINLNFQNLFDTYLDTYSKTIRQISTATSGQLYFNNLSKAVFEIGGILFIVYAGLTNGIASQNNSLTGIELGILLFVLTRLGSISNQIYGVVLSLNTNFSQLSKYLKLRADVKRKEEALLFDKHTNIKIYRPKTQIVREKFSSITVFLQTDADSTSNNSTENSRYEFFDNLILESGKLTVITGDSGVGKSTLVNNILYSRFDHFNNNSASFRLEPIPAQDFQSLTLGSLAYVLTQSYKVSGLKLIDLLEIKRPQLKIFYEDLAFLLGDERAYELIEHKDTFSVDLLSGGEQQRLFLAFASGSNQHIIIVDESLDGLDNAARMRTLDLLTSRGKMVLMITHNLTANYKVQHRYNLTKNKKSYRALRALS